MISPDLRKMRLAGVILLLLCSTACSTTVRNHNKYFQNISDSKGVPAQEEDTVKMADRSPEELYNLGQLYLSSANQRLAKLHFLAALSKKNDFADAYVGLGRTLLLSADSRHAEQAFQQALELDPVNTAALLSLGKLYRNKSEFPLATQYFDRLLYNDPHNPVALTELAMTYDSMGELTLAEPLYEQVRKLKGSSASACNNVGFHLLLQGEYQRAIKEFKHALQLQPENKCVANNLAAAYALSNKEDSALQLMEKTVGKAEAYNNLGYLYITRGQWSKAEKALRMAMQIKPQYYARAKNNLAILAKKHDEAGRRDGTTDSSLLSPPE